MPTAVSGYGNGRQKTHPTRSPPGDVCVADANMKKWCDADPRAPHEAVHRRCDDLASLEMRPTVLLRVSAEFPNLAQPGHPDRALSVLEHVPEVSRDRLWQRVEPLEVNGTERLALPHRNKGLDEFSG